ncbi:MAG: transglutaminase domain-containing protein [Nanoarchaeota archaeon]|nr:transglutaminase domain-containing protein [Nanoarchaeota archaeon]
MKALHDFSKYVNKDLFVLSEGLEYAVLNEKSPLYIPKPLYEIAMKITKDLDDEFSKAISIYMAITFLYDYDEKANDELKGSAIKYILTNGNGTCYHKTMLFLILAKAAGLDARFVLVKEDMYGDKYHQINNMHALVLCFPSQEHITNFLILHTLHGMPNIK